MGSCLSTSKTFQGEGRTLKEPSPSTASAAPKPSAGHRLGGTSHPTETGSAGGSTSAADREARARAAEQRMSQQAAKGNPNAGKLSQKLESQKQSNPLQEESAERQPERVVVSALRGRVDCPCRKEQELTQSIVPRPFVAVGLTVSLPEAVLAIYPLRACRRSINHIYRLPSSPQRNPLSTKFSSFCGRN